MKVAVLGAGPSGMMATWAALQCGHEVHMMSDDFTSQQNYGVFFLHDRCDLPIAGETIYQIVVGGYGKSADEMANAYGKFVYGNPTEGWGILLALEKRELVGYDPNVAMGLLTVILEKVPKSVRVFEGFGTIVALLNDGFDRVVCTVPAPAIFPDREFPYAYTWVSTRQVSFGQNFFMDCVNPAFGWNRLSCVFGRFSVEFPYEVADAKRIRKVLSGSEVISLSSDILFTGRYGAWDRKIRTEHVYQQVLKFLG